MIEVAVIGGGSAGIVAARQLLANGLKVCVFEATSTLAGAWSTSASTSTPTAVSNHNNGAGMMWDGLHTNLSKHTCRFSDLPWPSDTPTFPSKEDMDFYLKSYANEYIINNDDDDDNGNSCSFLYNCKVNKIKHIIGDKNNEDPTIQISSTEGKQYRVEWTDTIKQTQHSKEFGGVVVASGFFSKPKYPSGLLSEITNNNNNNNSNSNSKNSNRMKIIHSKNYYCHEQFASTSENENNKIVIIGGSHSALAIAVDVSKSVMKDHLPITVVMPKIPWVLPRYVPISTEGTTSATTGFLPIDLAFYRRQNQFLVNDNIINKNDIEEEIIESIPLTPESCRKRNQQLQELIGPRQQNILPVSSASSSYFDEPPIVAVSDYFLDLVADGTIEVIQGRAEGITDDGTGLIISRNKKNDETDDNNNNDDDGRVKASTKTTLLPNVTSVICCTGYLPDLESCCGRLDDDDDDGNLSILKTIEYDPNDTFSPMTMYLETLHPKLTNFAFVGMYRGPYMGVVELQAKLAAKVMSGKVTVSSNEFQKGLETSRMIRNQIASVRPQFPHFNYVGFMDTLARSLVISNNSDEEHFPNYNLDVGKFISPAFYQSDDSIAKLAQKEIDDEIEKGNCGYYLPRVVASALIGSWTFQRNIVHISGNQQSDYIHGSVRYSRSKQLGYVLYREDGLYKISDTKSLPVFREYEYVPSFSQDDDGNAASALELYFVEGGKRTYLFLSLKFQHQDEDGYWVATNDHLCVKDLYKAKFRIKLDGLTASEVIITYRVKGPSKDYESTTIMTPRI
jgi:hypothetical protein